MNNDHDDSLQHWGVKGMKWKKKKSPAEIARDNKQMDDLDNGRLKARGAFKSSKMLSEWYDRFKVRTLAQDKQIRDQQHYQTLRGFSEKLYKEKQAKQGALDKVGNAFGSAASKVVGSVNGAKNKFFNSKLWDGGFNKAMGAANQRESLNNATRNLANIKRNAYNKDNNLRYKKGRLVEQEFDRRKDNTKESQYAFLERKENSKRGKAAIAKIDKMLNPNKYKTQAVAKRKATR